MKRRRFDGGRVERAANGFGDRGGRVDRAANGFGDRVDSAENVLLAALMS